MEVSWLVMEVVMEMVMTGDGGDGDGGVMVGDRGGDGDGDVAGEHPLSSTL